jgi:hypothetical protein
MKNHKCNHEKEYGELCDKCKITPENCKNEARECALSAIPLMSLYGLLSICYGILYISFPKVRNWVWCMRLYDFLTVLVVIFLAYIYIKTARLEKRAENKSLDHTKKDV